jgi:hypothetical protein
MAAQQDTQLVLKCRYRYATACDWEGRSQPSQHNHEKTSATHASHRITLTVCPACGKDCGDETGRGSHLSTEHSIRARTEQRMEADARQVAELYAEQYGKAEVPVGSSAALVIPATWVPPSNGHAPDPAPATLDLLAAQEAFAGLIAEVEQLRAENAALRTEAAVLHQVRAALAE